MSRGKHLSLKEGRKGKKVEQFAKNNQFKAIERSSISYSKLWLKSE